MSDKGNDLDRMLTDLGIATDEGSQPGGTMPEAMDMDAAMMAANVVPEDADSLDRTEAFLVGLLLNLDPTYTVEVFEVSDTEVHADISGGDPGRLIGKAGRTLSALEQIVNAVVNKAGDDAIRVNIDVGGYKRRRDERITKQTRSVADEVRKHGEPIELEPMTAAERRVAHMAIADDPDVRSESAGEGRERRVVIHPAYDDPSDEQDAWDDEDVWNAEDARDAEGDEGVDEVGGAQGDTSVAGSERS